MVAPFDLVGEGPGSWCLHFRAGTLNAESVAAWVEQQLYGAYQSLICKSLRSDAFASVVLICSPPQVFMSNIQTIGDASKRPTTVKQAMSMILAESPSARLLYDTYIQRIVRHWLNEDPARIDSILGADHC